MPTHVHVHLGRSRQRDEDTVSGMNEEQHRQAGDLHKKIASGMSDKPHLKSLMWTHQNIGRVHHSIARALGSGDRNLAKLSGGLLKDYRRDLEVHQGLKKAKPIPGPVDITFKKGQPVMTPSKPRKK